MAVVIDRFGRGMTVRDPGIERAKATIEREVQKSKRRKSSRRSSSSTKTKQAADAKRVAEEAAKRAAQERKSLEQTQLQNKLKRDRLRSQLINIQKQRADRLNAIEIQRQRQLRLTKNRQEQRNINKDAINKRQKIKTELDPKGIEIQNKLLLESGKSVVTNTLLGAKQLAKLGVGAGKSAFKFGEKLAESKETRQKVGEVIKDSPKFIFKVGKSAFNLGRAIGGSKIERDKISRFTKTSLKTLDDLTRESRKAAFEVIKTSPGEAVLVVGGELLLIGATSKGIKVLSKTNKKVQDKVLNLDPRLLKIEKDIIKIGKGSKKITLKVGGIKETKEPLSRQLKRSGKRVQAVSAQANKIVTFIRRKNIIRKPLPFKENLLNKKTRELLKRFDKGKLNSNEIIRLNKNLRQESKKLAGGQEKGIDLLERSTFFDPDRVLRKSRLALKDELEEGTFFDLIRGKASLFAKKEAKPQILFIDEFVEELPKTKEFKSIIAKIKKSTKAGKDPNLTKDELARLSRFQVTPSGKLKPIGSTTFQGGLEREVTIAPKEVIKRVKKLGTLRVGNKRIPIVAVKIVKGKKNVNIIKSIEKIKDNIKLLRNKKQKLKSKKITKSTLDKKSDIDFKIKTLIEKKRKLIPDKDIKSKELIDKKIKKEVDKLNKIKKKTASKEVKEFLRERRTLKRKKVFKAGRRIAPITSSAVRRIGAKRLKKPISRKPGRTTPTTPKRTPTKPGRVSPKPITGRKSTKLIKTPARITKEVKSAKKIIRLRKKKRKLSEKKIKKQGYNVFARPIKKPSQKRKSKLLKINKTPLTKSKAKDLRNYVLDTSLSRTGKIKPTRLNPKPSKIKIPVAYESRSSKKFRKFKIVNGKRVSLRNVVIEKRGKALLDTRQEKAGITLRKRIAQIRKPIKKIKRKATPAQLAALKKARSKLKKLKGRKK